MSAGDVDFGNGIGGVEGTGDVDVGNGIGGVEGIGGVGGVGSRIDGSLELSDKVADSSSLHDSVFSLQQSGIKSLFFSHLLMHLQ